MVREYYKFFHILLFTSFTGVLCDEFGLKLTTENPKTKENTQYRFRYFVKDETTGDYKVQEETKEGDSVHGSYTIAEPNGNLRTVTYKAGPGKGFEAKVKVQPNASPIKPLLEETTVTYITTPYLGHSNETEKPVTTKSNITPFPGGFTVDITNNPEQKPEVGMNFLLKTTTLTNTVAGKNTMASSLENSKSTEEISTETSYGSTSDDLQKEDPWTEGRDVKEDSIKKEIEDALNSMPKLPELVLPDNKTHLKFHKDPEEALLDERITQIARQLAETSLRREYEERKLGHIIPISVTPITTSRYLSKAFKLRPTEGPVQVLNHVNLVPQYIYRDIQIPRFAPFDRFPMIRPVPNSENILRQIYEPTNSPYFQNIQKAANSRPELNQAFTEPISVMPLHVPTFLQFFSPYVTSTIRMVPQQGVPGHQIPINAPMKDITESIPLTSDKIYTQVTDIDKKSTQS